MEFELGPPHPNPLPTGERERVSFDLAFRKKLRRNLQ
jgi:hypothetical protein